MTNEIKDGGPAFPSDFIMGNSGALVAHKPFSGMSLRDWFAGQAPEVPNWWGDLDQCFQPPGWEQGMNNADWERLWSEARMRRVVLWRYAYADAMLAARASQGGQP